MGGGRFGLEVDGHVERLGASEQHVETRVVQKTAVGQAVDHGPAKAVRAHGALQFVRRLGRGPHRQVGEARVTFGVPGDDPGEGVVGVAGKGDSLLARQQVRAGTCQREHLDRDAGGVQVGEPGRADFREPGLRGMHDGRRLVRRRVTRLPQHGGINAPAEVGQIEMFFEGDGAHRRGAAYAG